MTNETTLTSEQVDELTNNVRGAHWVNLLVRRDGQDYYYQADYLRHVKAYIDALREQLAEAQADVQALADTLRQHGGKHD